MSLLKIDELNTFSYNLGSRDTSSGKFLHWILPPQKIAADKFTC